MINQRLVGQPTNARWFVFVIVAFLLSLAAYLPFDYTAHSNGQFYFFEADLISDHAGISQVYYDIGRGFNEGDSSSHALSPSASAVHQRYPLATGNLRQVRFDFNNQPGHYLISHAQITDFKGKVLRTFAPTDFALANGVQERSVRGDEMELIVSPGDNDPYLNAKLFPPLELAYGWAEWLLVAGKYFVPIFVGLLVLARLSSTDMFSRCSSRAQPLRRWCAERPLLVLVIVAFLSVLIQLRPIIFSGKSFVSPNLTYILYDHFPSAPGYSDPTTRSFNGSDIAALIYQQVPYSKIEHDSIFHDHELPLWNRYNLGGTPLLGQGQSMFGEVLNMIPILARGAAWSWDLKFVLARWLFGFSLGFFVYKISRSQPAACVIAMAAPWIGFFEFRVNHPAQFSLCLSPLLLIAWAQLSSAETRRSLVGWSAFLAFAHWELMTSGTVKEAYITILIFDLVGLVYLVTINGFTIRTRRQVIAACVAGIVFVLISAPLWWTFFDTLALSHTSYDVPVVRQIPAWQFIGVFEDMFYRRFNPFENHGNPSANVVALLGVAWFIASLIRNRNRGAVALLIATMVPFSFAFGIVPASLLLRTPFLGNIYHVGNTFSCSLVVLLLALAGLGFADLEGCWGTKEIRSRLWVALGIIFFLCGIYFAHSWHQPRSSFFAGYILSLGLVTAALVLALLKRSVLGATLLLLVALVGGAELLWRHGNYNDIQFDKYVISPRVRAALDAPSPAIDEIKRRASEPSRVAGLGLNLFCGASQFYLEEGIYGVDALRSAYYDDFMKAVNLPKAYFWGNGDIDGGERNESRGAMDLLNVRFYLDSLDPSSPVSGLIKGPSLDVQIYESPTVWPRAFFTNNVVEDPDLAHFAAKLVGGQTLRPFADIESAEAQQLRDENILQRSGPIDPVVTPAHDYKLTTNTTSFVVDVSGPGMIVLTEAFYPKDFRVFLNDKRVAYLRTNYAFKGIPISAAGTYEVRVEYWPHHFTQALILMTAGLLMGAALVVFPELRQARRVEALNRAT